MERTYLSWTPPGLERILGLLGLPDDCGLLIASGR